MQRILYSDTRVPSPVATRDFASGSCAALQAPAICVNLPAFHEPDPFQGPKMKTGFRNARARTTRLVPGGRVRQDARQARFARLPCGCAASTGRNSRPTSIVAITSSSSMRRRWRSPATSKRDKVYQQHTGYLGNLKTIALGKLLARTPGARDRVRGQGHAAEDDSRPADVPQAARVRGHRASARRTAAEAARALRTRTWHPAHPTPPAGASRPRPASS
mgnify:CR=1 FL=1